jgi:hypothetical protein
MTAMGNIVLYVTGRHGTADTQAPTIVSAGGFNRGGIDRSDEVSSRVGGARTARRGGVSSVSAGNEAAQRNAA